MNTVSRKFIQTVLEQYDEERLFTDLDKNLTYDPFGELERLRIINNLDYNVFNARSLGYCNVSNNSDQELKKEAVVVEAGPHKGFPILIRSTPNKSIEEYAARMNRIIHIREELRQSYNNLYLLRSNVHWSYSKPHIIKVFCSTKFNNSIEVCVKVLDYPNKMFISDLYSNFELFKEAIIDFIYPLCSDIDIDYAIDYDVDKIVEDLESLLCNTHSNIDEYCKELNTLLLANANQKNIDYPALDTLSPSREILATYYTNTLQLDFIEVRSLKEICDDRWEEFVDLDYAIKFTESDDYLYQGKVSENIYGNFIHGLIWSTEVKEELLKVSNTSEVAHNIYEGANFYQFSEAFTEIAFVLLSKYIKKFVG